MLLSDIYFLKAVTSASGALMVTSGQLSSFLQETTKIGSNKAQNKFFIYHYLAGNISIYGV
jgi:hypothetical protein